MSEDQYAYGKPGSLTFHIEVVLKLQRECAKRGIPAEPREIAIDHDHIEAYDSLRQLIRDDLHRPYTKAFLHRFPLREYSTIPDAELIHFAMELEKRQWYRF